MVMRNQWLLPAVVLIVLAMAAAVVFGEEALRPSMVPQQPGTSVLRVPAQYASIQAAIDAARPGDLIQVAAGTYNESITLAKEVDLVAAHPDALEPANNTTILDGNEGQAAVFIPGGLAHRPTLTGFVIRNGQHGIDAHSPFTVQDCYFYGSQIAVLYGPGSGGLNRNNVYYNSSDDAVQVQAVSLPLRIEGNRFLYSGDDAIELDLPAAQTVAPVVIDVFNNVLAGSRQDGLKLVNYDDGPQDANRHIQVTGNLMANNRRAGVGFVHSGNTNEDYSAAAATESVRLYNNTFYGNDYGISGGANLVAFNNIIANSALHGAWRVQAPDGSGSVIAYTLFWHNGTDVDQSVEGQGDIFGQDPLFAGASAPGPDGSWGTVDDDFSGLVLQPDSPAIDRGVAQYTAATGEEVPAAPLTGFNGSAPDLGWHEAGGNALEAATPSPTRTAGPAVTATSAVVLPPAAPLVASTATTASHASTASSTSTVTPAAGRGAGPSATASSIPAAGSITPSPTSGSPTASATNETPGPTAEVNTPTATALPVVAVVSVAPTSATTGDTVTLTVSGSGFQPGLVLSFEGGTGTPPNVVALQVLDPTTILATTEALNSTTQAQTWDVRIDNPDGSSALLDSGFTVNP